MSHLFSPLSSLISPAPEIFFFQMTCTILKYIWSISHTITGTNIFFDRVFFLLFHSNLKWVPFHIFKKNKQPINFQFSVQNQQNGAIQCIHKHGSHCKWQKDWNNYYFNNDKLILVKYSGLKIFPRRNESTKMYAFK